MIYFLLAALAVIVLITVFFSLKRVKDEVDVDQTFHDLYTDSLAKEIELKQKLEAEYYYTKQDLLPEVEEPAPEVIEPKKVAKKKAAKKKTAKKKTAKKRTAKKVVKDEEV